MAPISSPIYGDESVIGAVRSGETWGQGMEAGGKQAGRWLVGAPMMEDLERWTTAAQNPYLNEQAYREAAAYRGNLGATQIVPQGGGYTQAMDADATVAGWRKAPQQREVTLGATPDFQRTQIDPTQQAQMRGAQQALVAAQQRRAAGQAPSVAQLQMQAGVEQAGQQARSMAAQQRGVSPALAARMAQQQQTAAGLQAAQQGGILRAGEMAQAEQALGGTLSGARGQDIGLAQQQAGLSQQASAAEFGAGQQRAALQAQLQQQARSGNLQAQMQQQAQNDQMVQYYTSQGFSRDQAQQQANMEMERLRMEQAQATAAREAGMMEAQIEREQKASAGMLGAAGTFVGSMFSDENLKTDKAKADGEVSEFLDALEASRWRYKDPERHGRGDPTEHYGIMAQDAQKSRLGRSIVRPTSEGLALDAPKTMGALLAATAGLHKRLRQVEGRR